MEIHSISRKRQGKAGRIQDDREIRYAKFDGCEKYELPISEGSAFFGRAIFVDSPNNPNYKQNVAHEFRHVRQIEHGKRIFCAVDYFAKNNVVGTAFGYEQNSYEEEADLYCRVYIEGYVDIYGRDISGKGIEAFRR